jgi:nitrate reductase alpha subunit
MKLELKIMEQHNNADNELPLFEPMHLVDYFASQGIKLTEETQTADKLGKQLKSFTEWLKTMKKVHSTEPGQHNFPAINAAIQADDAILALAEMSNKEDEVLTESMAEVFAKQGKTGKAIEVYEKLSLLNPSKNAYFAAKIEQLKGT